ncbi:uncharacterized protein JCM15063_003477 [Sporobolomyces koalae]|uniref:uncharacterized protein n=1 Tax=Sporobolomyces koalae TaxID=500713 RepID=UPI00317D233E
MASNGNAQQRQEEGIGAKPELPARDKGTTAKNEHIETRDDCGSSTSAQLGSQTHQTSNGTIPFPRANSPRSMQSPPSPSLASVQQVDTRSNSTPRDKRDQTLDFDNLLGPPPARRVAAQTPTSSDLASTSRIDPIASNDDSREIGNRLQGLGFTTPTCADDSLERGGSVDSGSRQMKPGAFRDGGYFDDGEDTDESWLNYSSSSKHGDPHTAAPSSNTSHQHMSSPKSESPPSHVSSPPNAGLNTFGSPLSPHVPPFSPGLAQQANGENTSTPWTTPSADVLSSRAREREASWNSVASSGGNRLPFPSPSIRATFANPTASHASSNRSYSPFGSSPPLSHRLISTEVSNSSSPGIPHASSMPFTPPSSFPETFESHQPEDPGQKVFPPGYVRTPFLAPSSSLTPTIPSGAHVELTAPEEITTLFIFGFPDDMLEREFQNLFFFAPGFEAATLKMPSSNANGTEANEGIQNGSGTTRTSLDDHGKDEYLKRDSCVSPALNGNGTKKQPIGFAKFQTKRDALEAMEHLNRRKVDLEQGSLLKAEMAKKNLYVKKPILPVALPPHGEYGLTSNANVTNGSTPTAIGSLALGVPTDLIKHVPDSGPSIPLSALDPETLQRLANSGNVNPAVLAEIARQNAAGFASSNSMIPPATTASNGMTAYEAFHSVPPAPFNRKGDSQYPNDDQTSPFLASEHAQTASVSSSVPSQSDIARYTNSLHQQLDQGTVYGRSASESYPDPSPLLPSESTFSSSLVTRERQASYPQQSTIAPALPYGTFGSQLVPAVVRPQTQAQLQAGSALAQQQAQMVAAQAYGRNQNPADMNSPKNTLYIGGLPAVLPSLTGPFSASHLEDSLRNAFARCPGFKRLQFRSKSNGPIVFVEFEDTAYATRAMNEMYGYTLGGLVKGGIRLSYSKNPLGVRSNGLPSGNPPPLPTTLLGTAHHDHGSYAVYPSYTVSYTAPAHAQSLSGSVHRRYPDPFFNGSPYPAALQATAHLGSSASAAIPASTDHILDSASGNYQSLDSHLHQQRPQPVAAIGTPSQAQSTSASFGSTASTATATPPSTFSSTFSPFGAEY